ncbi:tRNA-splicing endonuclease subunit sen54 [Ophidiomyces ophidiicola]|nr:tRNA-splicing endonuclease subunit sen54 [Ophidiomyces ophidiicola]KAI1994426.1 tRNA-splicing endonuclease subunit sen54 [Ophidiomyces ophidiicola]KAI1994968.1 tRNA-splicing endonuclease subunit sen54 [Ophidiomyces ophidiicola]KAI1997823.1 tRNA-splicing endonuclease subunit sen54 [Ophidiomyces ophidiicola]
MADADEDSLLRPSSLPDPSASIDHDISDETQDFRFLSNISSSFDPTQQSLPRRGEKDFEPNPTLHQAGILAASRDAMHNALTFPRLHNPINGVIGIFCPDGILEPAATQAVQASRETNANLDSKLTEENTTGVAQNKACATRRIYRPRGEDLCVCVPNPKGQLFRTMGQADRFNRIWLLPEEALYCLERGSLDIRWPPEPSENGEIDAVDAIAQGIPMSLQAAYACFIGRGGVSIERYTVYAGLKRGGYVVIRAEGWDAMAPGTPGEMDTQMPARTGPGEQEVATGFLGILSRLFSLIVSSHSTYSSVRGPVVGLGAHRSYNDIYRALSIIPVAEPDVPDSDPRNTQSAAQAVPPYRVAFHVYKPSTPFRKSSPGTPDFRIAVVNARLNPAIPTLAELSSLLATTPLSPPRGEKLDRMMYMRLRHGWRNVILGIVDQGVVSYLRISDAGFIKEPLYEQKGSTGGRGKGGRGPTKKKG